MRHSLMRLGREGVNPTMLQNTTVEDHLDLLIDLQHYLGKALAPYEEFVLGRKTYYLNRAGFLHRKDSGSEEVRGSFCGYLDDEVWKYLKNYVKEG